jgi:adenylosuccinate synthase
MIHGIITVGMGFGDEGKGATVDYLCRRYDAKLVVRYSGGAQCAHNVVTPEGVRHPFAQFGSGTFAGVPTWLGEQVIIDPITMVNEAKVLEACGINRPFTKLQFHPRCLVATPLHAYVNHRTEISEGNGSCGMGIGATRKYWLKYGLDAIFAEDLGSGECLKKLELMRQRMLLGVHKNYREPLPGDFHQDDINETYEKSLAIQHVLQGYMHQQVESEWDYRIRPQALISEQPEFVGPGVRRYWDEPQVIVFEGAQGVLLDENHGYHPHTTWSDVTPRFAWEMCKSADQPLGFSFDSVSTIGITRCYATRHGAGPFPTQISRGDRDIADIRLSFMKDVGNPEKHWQGSMRFGLLDIPMLQYAAKIIRKTCPLDYLAVNCLDEMDGSFVACYERSTLNRASRCLLCLQVDVVAAPRAIKDQDLPRA